MYLIVEWVYLVLKGSPSFKADFSSFRTGLPSFKTGFSGFRTSYLV